jgi:hypothetical protein
MDFTIFIEIENISRKSDWKSVLQEKFESITAKEKKMHCSLEKLIQPAYDFRKVWIAGCRKMSIMSSHIIQKSGSNKKDALSTRSITVWFTYLNRDEGPKWCNYRFRWDTDILVIIIWYVELNKHLHSLQWTNWNPRCIWWPWPLLQNKNQKQHLQPDSDLSFYYKK